MMKIKQYECRKDLGGQYVQVSFGEPKLEAYFIWYFENQVEYCFYGNDGYSDFNYCCVTNWEGELIDMP